MGIIIYPFLTYFYKLFTLQLIIAWSHFVSITVRVIGNIHSEHLSCNNHKVNHTVYIYVHWYALILHTELYACMNIHEHEHEHVCLHALMMRHFETSP